MAEPGSTRPFTLAAIALSAAYVGVLAATAPAMGYTRDEGYYFKAAEQYGAWWDTLFSKRFAEAFGDAEIKLRFGYNTEHPALVKLTQGITFRVLHQWFGLTGPAQGFRFTGFLFGGLSLLAAYFLGRRTVSAPAGLIAAALMATMPRYFYDAHLACFDVPITAMWTLSLWAFWRALDEPDVHPVRRAIVAGLVWGLAISTKLNALFLPFVFLAVWIRRGRVLEQLRIGSGPSGGLDLRLPAIPHVFIGLVVLGPLVFVAHWPYLWHETFARIGAYVGFHLNHEHYPIRYFHTVFMKPPFPWHFPWVMTALTVPVPILAVGALCVVWSIGRAIRGSSADLLLLLGALLPIAMINLPDTPIFGGVKHWYPGLPSLCIIAARGLVEGGRAIAARAPKLRVPATAALALLCAVPGVLGIAASHPNGIGFYNELAGGIRGGAALGMQRSFWGGLSRPLLPEISRFPPGTRVFFDHTNWDAVAMYQREGLLPRTIGFANAPEQADAATLFVDREGYPFTEDGAFSRVDPRPLAGVYADGVTMVQLHGPARR